MAEQGFLAGIPIHELLGGALGGYVGMNQDWSPRTTLGAVLGGAGLGNLAGEADPRIMPAALGATAGGALMNNEFSGRSRRTRWPLAGAGATMGGIAGATMGEHLGALQGDEDMQANTRQHPKDAGAFGMG